MGQIVSDSNPFLPRPCEGLFKSLPSERGVLGAVCFPFLRTIFYSEKINKKY